MNRRRIDLVVVLPTGNRGGAEKIALGLARRVASDGANVLVMLLTKDSQGIREEFALLGSTVSVADGFFSNARLGYVLGLARVVWLSALNRVGVVFSTHAHVNAMLGFLRRGRLLSCSRLVARESTLIFERFGGLKRAIMSALYHAGYGTQDLLVSQTREMKESLEKWVPQCLPKRHLVIANPYWGSLEHARSVDCERAECRIVACGRLHPIKRFEELIRAVAEVRSHGHSFVLEVIGDGPSRPDLVRLVRDLGVCEFVRFRGYCPRPVEVMAGASIGVVTSALEGFPNVVLDMMAAGVRRIISTPCAPALERIPGLAITKGFGSTDIARQIEVEYASGVDDSKQYRQYLLEHHSPERFVGEVMGK